MSFPGEGIASSLIAGGLNYLGQSSANKANRKLAHEQMAFQSASTPSGAGFSAEKPVYESPMKNAASSAMQGLQMQQSMKQTAADTDLKASQSDLARQNTVAAVNSSNLDQQRTIQLARENEISGQGVNDLKKASEISANTAKRAAQFESSTFDYESKRQLVNSTLGTVNSAASVLKPWSGGGMNTNSARKGYDESLINPGTGEVYRERQVRYK